jgi:hypothetical protein
LKKLIVLALVLVSLTSRAQNISGLVLSAKDKSPVPFASVALLQLPDSSIQTGVITLTGGEFSFDNIKPGKYFVKVSYLGYAPNGKPAEVTTGNKQVVVDTIFLAESSQSLDEVTVTGERLKGQELVDRTVYSIPAKIAQSSSNGYEILKKIPQIQVDFQNNITMNGSTNFIIQVDGKQRDKEFLAKLNPEDIQSIEVINNPSGRYEGNIDGVINVILKKEARFGLSGTAGAQYKPFNKATLAATGSLDYGMGKISVYATAFSFVQSLNINTSTLSQYSSYQTENSLKGTGDFRNSSSSINTGFDYYIDDKNNLSFNINYKPTKQLSEMDNTSLTTSGNSVTNAIKLTPDSRTLSDEGSTSLFYKRNFKKQVQEFTVETQFYLFQSRARDKRNESVLEGYSMPGFTPSGYYELGSSDRKYFSTKINYVHPLGMAVKLETGYQLYYQQMDYDFYTNLTNSTNAYQYSEFRHSVYGGITFNSKKWGLQGNIRVENTNNDINSSIKSDYFCVLPSTNVQYKISTKQNVKFTYNRRINRPGIYDLNPFEKIAENNDISKGNPLLEPEYRNRLQFTYTLNISSYYVSPYVYYEHITDKIGQQKLQVISSITNNPVTFSQPGNLLTGDEKGVGLSSLFYFVSVNARYFKGTFKEYVSPTQIIPARNYSSYSVNGYLFAQYPKKAKLTEFVFFQYAGVNTDAYSKTYNLPLYGLGFQKQTEHHTFGLVYVQPFAGNVEFTKTITQTPVMYGDSRVSINLRGFVMFTYQYKFNRGKGVKKINRKLDVESDSKKDAIGM